MNPEIVDAIEYDEKHVDIEAIMRQIRAYLAQERGTRAASRIDEPTSIILDREVYDELYAANQEFDKGQVTPYLTPTHIPVIGGIWQRVRSQLHSLVIYYVDRAADNQMSFNVHVVRVLNGIVRGIDTDQTPDRVTELERRVEMLEKQIRRAGGTHGYPRNRSERGLIAVHIHMMTPTLTTGDAIGNYMISLQRVFAQLGVSVWLYADYIDPAYRHNARPTAAYHATGNDILWFHYSIWGDNFAVLDQSTDFKVMDYHGVTPVHLMRDDPRLAVLCDKAIKGLPVYSRVFDWCIYHADNGLWDLQPAGYTRLSKVRLPVDSAFLRLKEDEELSAMVQQLEYVLFVGRIVPQKDVISIVRVFAEVQKRRPQTCMLLVGGFDLLPAYVDQVNSQIQRLGIENRVHMTGKVSDRTALAALFRHAKFLICLSDWESFFVPAVESMFFGVPVIYTGEPPVSENVGDAGVVIDKRDPVGAAKQIITIWEDSEAYSKLQEKATARSTRFTDAALAEGLQGLLAEWATAFGPSEANAVITDSTR